MSRVYSNRQLIHRFQSGFTLVEILVAITIVGLTLVFGVTSLVNFNKQEALTSEAEKVLTLLTKARALTLSAKGGEAFGVHFEERVAVLFSGDTYVAGTSSNEVQLLNDAVKISDVSLAGGGSAVVFQRLTGSTDNFGTVTLAAVRDESDTKTITIEATGTVYGN